MIGELQAAKDFLESEGERVQREAAYHPLALQCSKPFTWSYQLLSVCIAMVLPPSSWTRNLTAASGVTSRLVAAEAYEAG